MEEILGWVHTIAFCIAMPAAVSCFFLFEKRYIRFIPLICFSWYITIITTYALQGQLLGVVVMVAIITILFHKQLLGQRPLIDPPSESIDDEEVEKLIVLNLNVRLNESGYDELKRQVEWGEKTDQKTIKHSGKDLDIRLCRCLIDLFDDHWEEPPEADTK